MNDLEVRQCSICGEIKPLTKEYFYYRNDSKKFRHKCIVCYNKKIQDKNIGNKTNYMSG